MERKFLYDFDIEKRLVKLGAQKYNRNLQQNIVDEYYDNFSTYFLLFNDYYLRSRTTQNKSNEWQLKYPSQMSEHFKGNKDSIKNFENYFELNQTQQIITEIFNLRNRNSTNSHDCKTIESLINDCELKCFAKINSSRKSYIIRNYSNIRIDLDETDFNYRLGELELILDSTDTKENVQKALENISALTSKLGKYFLEFY